MKLGKLAAWVLFYAFDARNGAAFAQRVERWGYDAIWIPEAHGRDPLIGASWILANTTMLKVATGVANIYARDSLATVNAQYALAEQSEDVFCLELEYRTSLLLKDFAVISTKNRSLRVSAI